VSSGMVTAECGLLGMIPSLPPALKPLKIAVSSACAVFSAALTTAAGSSTAPHDALSSSMISNSNGMRTSISGTTRLRARPTARRGPSVHIVRWPVLTAAYCQP